MSYAGSARGSRNPAKHSASANTGRRSNGLPGPPSAGDTDWQQVAIFGAGLALGIALGAGAALLAAPHSGAETRAALRARGGRLGRAATRRGRDAWDELRDEIRGVKRTLRRRRLQRSEERALAELERETAEE